ncbi:disks large homolog 5-like [Microtus oregoni]|uniref:disks large homolog 5-like n=1 Tax=Microtus oregoni TaxID=111838 RepID=UPI001BB1B586|nr:disks large homolog 5-like [Microtus oregoni]
MLARLSRLLGRQKGEHNETRGRQKEAGPQPQCCTSRHKWFWGKCRSTGKTSTPNSVTGQEQRMNKVATLTLQLQMMTQERNELRGILANYTNKDLNNRLNFELEMLNMEHKKVMLDLQKFPMEMREALYKCKELTEETVSYSILHNQLLSERTQLKKKVSMLREENQKLRREQISLLVACEKVKNLYEKTDEKFCELCDEGDKESSC